MLVSRTGAWINMEKQEIACQYLKIKSHLNISPLKLKNNFKFPLRITENIIKKELFVQG